jgi:nucleotide-binding universal stress UspA family protein
MPDPVFNRDAPLVLDPAQISFSRILVSMALREPSVTLAYARRLAAVGKTELRLVHVVEFSAAGLSPATLAQMAEGQTSLDLRQRTALAQLERHSEFLSQSGISCGATVRIGTPHEQILEEAQQYKPNLIIVGNRAAATLPSFVGIGRTTDKVIRGAHCPVLVAYRGTPYAD